MSRLTLPRHALMMMLQAVLLLVLAAAVHAAPDKVPVFTTLGEADPSTGGGLFWRPGVSIATGIPGHIAQHITLAGEGTSCSASGKACGMIMLTTDGGKTYTTVKNVSSGTADSNFNGHGDLGTFLPPKATNKSTGSAAAAAQAAAPGEFNTLVAAGLRQGSRQTWLDGPSGLKVTANASVSFAGTPSGLNLSSPSQTIVRKTPFAPF